MEEIKHSRMKSDEKLANAVVVTPETKKPKVKITKRLLSAYNLFLKYNSVIQASFDTLDDRCGHWRFTMAYDGTY